MGEAFRTVRRWDLEWIDDGVLTLRNGVQVKIPYEDRETDHTDMLIKFPRGCTELGHTHDLSDSAIVLEGEQIVAGEHMRPGDYGWASGPEPHCPFEYLEGCLVVFASCHDAPARYHYEGSSAGKEIHGDR